MRVRTAFCKNARVGPWDDVLFRIIGMLFITTDNEIIHNACDMIACLT